MSHDVKAEEGPPYEGKPAFHGYYRTARGWVLVRNAFRLPIAYTSEQAAEEGARRMFENTTNIGQNTHGH